MQIETLIYIILVGIVAILLALFQYIFKKKSMSKLNMLFAFFRFLSIFSILLLLINPKFEQEQIIVEKPNLVLAIDNSSSIKHLNQSENAKNVFLKLTKNKSLNEKFNISTYCFGNTLIASDSLSFSDSQTNINEALDQLAQIYNQKTAPIILISDGNQTYGNDFAHNSIKQPIYPIILGDTTVYKDLKIQQLNVNRYAYLKNRFPVEAILVYDGIDYVNSQFIITNGKATVYSEFISFSKDLNSKVINFTLPANSVGVSSYKAFILPIDGEKNIINNYKNFAVEIIDQKTKIAIVSDFSHPDLGALKKSIEANEQRSVTILNSKEIINEINEFQLIIIYQPNNKFKDLYAILERDNKNRFVIIGPKSDLYFINQSNSNYTFQITNQTEDYQALLNYNYSPFLVNNIDFQSFPPLKSDFGSIKFNVLYDVVLNKTVNGISTNEPLLLTFETNGRREGVLFGENIWQWRAHSYINNKSFNPFDDFVGKLIQYLASNTRKSRLNIDYNSFYNGSDNVIIKAELFDKNYLFDDRETLIITLKDENSKEEKSFPLILKNNNYQVDLSSLAASTYNFTIRATNENVSKSGSFQILEYDVEQQFLNANVTKLKQIATKSNGKEYFLSASDNLINDLLIDNRFASIQKSNKNTIPLIDWKYLLGIIVFCLSTEWFLRKYNGLI